jgi:hypothetical protein
MSLRAALIVSPASAGEKGRYYTVKQSIPQQAQGSPIESPFLQPTRRSCVTGRADHPDMMPMTATSAVTNRV